MKTFSAILLIAAGIAAANAACPNMCSGHGGCTTDDQCRCWRGYEGYDCSQRSCPYVEAWAVDNAEGPHNYAECAGKGICDRSTGLCECFPGYDGRGCERSSCANGCSGHGTCRLIADLPVYKEMINPATALTGSNWDRKAITSCVCDGGYVGADCSQRVCPYGDDPMTVCEEGFTEQIQRASFEITGAYTLSPAVTGNVGPQAALLQNADGALQFKSFANEVFYTDSFPVFSASTSASSSGCDEDSGDNGVVDSTPCGDAYLLASSLESLPNFRIRDVDVIKNALATSSDTKVSFSYDITFRHENSGNSYGSQNILACPHTRAVSSSINTYGCGGAGCQPRILQPRYVSALQVATVAGAITARHATTFEYTNAATSLTVGTAAGDSWAGFTSESVLTCPTGKTCAPTTNAMQGAIHLQVIEIARNGGSNDALVYARGVGTSDIMSDDSVAVSAGLGGATASTDSDGGSTAAGDYTFLGYLTDFPAYGSNVRVNISSIMPDTSIEVLSYANLFGASVLNTDTFAQIILAFTTAQCNTVTDVTGGSSAPFENIDVENIECAGRGECDRSSGLCQCFEGYTGNNCGSQTILV